MKQIFTTIAFFLVLLSSNNVWGQGCTGNVCDGSPVTCTGGACATAQGSCAQYDAAGNLICCENMTCPECITTPLRVVNGVSAAYKCWTLNADVCASSPVDCGLQPLPVELTAWKGDIMPDANKLEWVTSSEENTMAFVIERSGNGRTDWKEVGRVNAVGFAEDIHEYSFNDYTPMFVSYYRLRTIDFDGYYEYSDLIVLERDRKLINDILIAPNPVKDNWTRLTFASSKKRDARILLSDISGTIHMELKHGVHKGLNAVDLELQGLASGIYFLRIEMAEGVIGKKIILTSKK